MEARSWSLAMTTGGETPEVERVRQHVRVLRLVRPVQDGDVQSVEVA
jgi:hypothetical protein